VSAKNLKNLDIVTDSDPQCTLKVKEENLKYAVYKQAGETEVVDNNLNPQWIRHFSVNYSFLKEKELWFQVWNYNSINDKDLIGECKIKLSEIMMSSN